MAISKAYKVKLLAHMKWSEVSEYKLDEVLDTLGVKLPPEQSEAGQTTKYCPNCHNTKLLLLQTFNKKICTDCNTEIPWFLDKKQKPLL